MSPAKHEEFIHTLKLCLTKDKVKLIITKLEKRHFFPWICIQYSSRTLYGNWRVEYIKAKHSIFLKHKTMRKQTFLIPNHFAIFKLKNVFLKISFKKTFKVLSTQKKSLISWCKLCLKIELTKHFFRSRHRVWHTW